MEDGYRKINAAKDKPCFDILMGVGAKYYPTPVDFIKEAMRLGVSKRIPNIPEFFCFSRSRVWLVHWKTREIFAYFIPTQIEIIGDNKELLKQAEKYGARIIQVDPDIAASEPVRGCGRRVAGGGYIVAYPDAQTVQVLIDDLRKQGLLRDKDIFLAGILVVLKKNKRIKYKGPFTRGYRYIKVDVPAGTYKILKIKKKVKKIKKNAKKQDKLINTLLL